MSAQHSVLPHSAALRLQPALVAIVYANEAYPQSTFERIVGDCRRRGLGVAGVLQYPVCSEAADHCDVVLEELTTGLRTDLFEDRGPGASGCRLDEAALAEVNGQVARSLDAGPELLILNKFGKVEAEGQATSAQPRRRIRCRRAGCEIHRARRAGTLAAVCEIEVRPVIPARRWRLRVSENERSRTADRADAQSSGINSRSGHYATRFQACLPGAGV
ncbi:DUF2478 domain-containing protein [Bradyrhizobium icense]|uniref:DUF2478 domain-containing protein n=1 Tax=Bradyrhizobium icense TaxID=1274631 RepID=UPI0009F3003B